MDAYSQLRNVARAKRDSIIKAARAQYAQEMRELARMRRNLTGCRSFLPPPKGPTMMELFRQVLPHDRTFTLGEVIVLIREANPAKLFRPATVRSMFHRLLDTNEVQRVSKNEDGHVLWAATDFPVERDRWGTTTTADAIEAILRERGALRTTEIVVALQAVGFRPQLSAKTLHDSVRLTFRNNPSRFVRGEGGRWGLR
jgi:hypothetical protein